MIRVFIVDDDELTTRSLKRLIGSSVDVVGVNNDPDAAIREIEMLYQAGTPPDVVLSDMLMPTKTGIEVADAVEYMKIPVVIMSGNVGPHQQALDERIADGRIKSFIKKPVMRDVLIKMLEDAASKNP